MRKIVTVLIVTLLILLIVAAAYSYNPRSGVDPVDISYKGYAYMAEDSLYNKEVTISLKGSYDADKEAFAGAISVNRVSFTDCSLSPYTGLVCSYEGGRIRSGTVYFSSGLKQLSILVGKGPLYSAIEESGTYNGDLVVTIPSFDRASALLIHDMLKNEFQSRQQSGKVPYS
ncbi:hypothetical protein [Paenibacillus tarimensis]|uniref:hypothetical protein n=1 Tax=Paenibacillus tarimensis TaxID=416012 RepID=UPI001F2EE974|nr:hypothetical protein [Paenibacillus tarimensis]MCF2943468.1 hypothetical protein [Paenibacillus tarimensis]